LYASSRGYMITLPTVGFTVPASPPMPSGFEEPNGWTE
jgi:hypothetical protein